MNRRTLLKSCAAAVVVGPHISEAAGTEVADAFLHYRAAALVVNTASDLDANAREWVDYYYWRTRFWTAPCSTLEAVREKVRLADSDQGLSEDLRMGHRVEFEFDDSGNTIEAFLANVTGRPVYLRPNLYDDLVERYAQKRKDAEEESEAERVQAIQPRFIDIMAVDPGLIPSDVNARRSQIEKEMLATMDHWQVLFKQKREIESALLTKLNAAEASR